MLAQKFDIPKQIGNNAFNIDESINKKKIPNTKDSIVKMYCTIWIGLHMVNSLQP